MLARAERAEALRINPAYSDPVNWERFLGNCSQRGHALEAAKNELSRRGAKQRMGSVRAKNILKVTYLIVNHRFFAGFSALSP